MNSEKVVCKCKNFYEGLHFEWMGGSAAADPLDLLHLEQHLRQNITVTNKPKIVYYGMSEKGTSASRDSVATGSNLEPRES